MLSSLITNIKHFIQNSNENTMKLNLKVTLKREYQKLIHVKLK